VIELKMAPAGAIFYSRRQPVCLHPGVNARSWPVKAMPPINFITAAKLV